MLINYSKNRLRQTQLGLVLIALAVLATPPGLSAASPSGSGSYAQANPDSRTVSGVILDETGAPAVGASIVIEGKNLVGTSADIDGRFSLNAPADEVTLTISYIGYKTVQVKARAGQSVKVQLELDANMMEEVVVTGYGVFKKSAYAGSASTMTSTKLKEVPTASFMELLQGNTSGVQFQEQSGQPGSAAKINIRGMGSFNASTSPLYVIDGIPVMSGDITSTDSDAGLDLMTTINNSDIESITVIKDAAAASLYGSRAANGVVVITTKHGSTGKPQVSLKADWGFSDFAMQYRPIMGGAERREYMYNALYNRAIADGDSPEDAKAYADGDIDDYAPVPAGGYTDWDKLLFKKGSHSNYEVSLTGGSDKISYYSSLSYKNQEGITLNSGLKRISGRLNVDYQATKNLKVGANVLFSKVDQDVYSEGTSYTSPFYSSRNCVVPSDVPYNEDGSWNRDFIDNGDRNPLLAMTYDYNKEHVTRSFNTIYAQYEFFKDFKFKTTLSYDYIASRGDDWSDPRTSNGDDYNGAMEVKMYERAKTVWTNHLTYNTTFAGKNHIDALAGFEMDNQTRQSLSASAQNFATYEKNVLSNGKTVDGVGGSANGTRLVSYVTRVNYDYDNKYYLGASYRADGSSRLAEEKRWGSFWSASGAWRIIREDFMASTADWLTDLRLRASYGVNGTLPSDYYGYYGLSSLSPGYQGQPGILLDQIENKDLSWETNYNFNVGLDWGFANRVNFTLEFYNRDTRNLLMDRPISMTTGFSSYLMNIGAVRNRGLEFEINSRNVDNKNFTWTTNFNISHNKNTVLELDGYQTEIISGTQIHKVGYPYRTFYLIEFAGINPQTGAPQFYTNAVKADGSLDKEITEDPSDANYFVTDKHAEPIVVGGLSNTLRYLWFDLSFMFSYQFGGTSYDNWAQKTEHGGYEMGRNIPAYYRNSWKQPGDITTIEQFIEDPDVRMSSYATTRRLHSSDFIRLKTLQFGITLPKKWTDAIGMSNVRFYAAANNLWTWAKYDQYDPEAVANGSAIWGTPPLKTVTFGLNLNF